MKTIKEKDILEETTVCPYCMNIVSDRQITCCGESSAHFAQAYALYNGEVYLQNEIQVEKSQEDEASEILDDLLCSVTGKPTQAMEVFYFRIKNFIQKGNKSKTPEADLLRQVWDILEENPKDADEQIFKKLENYFFKYVA